MRRVAVLALCPILALVVDCGRTKPSFVPPPAGSLDGAVEANDAPGEPPGMPPESVDAPVEKDDASDVRSETGASDASDVATETGEAGGACIPAGQPTLNFMGTDCCSGLRAIVSGAGPSQGVRQCIGGIDQRVCSACGNGTCEAWELPCGCPEDCGASCGNSRCPLKSYCLIEPSDAGSPTARCVDIASDCPTGVLACNCASAKCGSLCFAERLTLACP